MFEKVYPHIWMALDKKTREHLVTVFDIKKTGITEILDQMVISDGYSARDLEVITLDKMIAYIGSEETFPRAWELTCMKAKYELNPPMELPRDKEPDVNIITEEEITNTTKNVNSKKGK